MPMMELKIDDDIFTIFCSLCKEIKIYLKNKERFWFSENFNFWRCANGKKSV